jgi:hypothetical protein
VRFKLVSKKSKLQTRHGAGTSGSHLQS